MSPRTSLQGAVIDESQLKVGILVHLLEYQGETFTIEELTRDLVDAGLVRAFVNKLIWDLFREQTGVLLRGNPLGTELTIPEDFVVSATFRKAHEEVVTEAVQSLGKVLPTYLRLLVNKEKEGNGG